MKTSETEVESFLNHFKIKLSVFDVIFTNRDKNLQGLFDLEINPTKRKEVLAKLEVKDFFNGPTKDVNNGPDLWEFGKIVNQKEVYIKVCMGNESRPVICISFHLAERAIVYPFK
jgi:hypothetical protein